MVQIPPLLKSFPLPSKPTQRQPMASYRPTQGMISSIDSADIPNDAFTLLKNGRTRLDKVLRRNGFTDIGQTALDANDILKLYFTKLLNGNFLLLRLTNDSISRLSSTGWLSLTGLPASGTFGSRISMATVFDRILLADDSFVNHVCYINGDTLLEVLDSPIAKFVTSCGDRAIAGYTNEVDGAIMVKWTAAYKPGDLTALQTWDLSVNEEAGFQRLIENPADISDFITGLGSWGTNLIVLRDKSITLGIKQDSPTAPFRFYTPDNFRIGSDCSYATEKTKSGFVFADSRTRSIYVLDGTSIEQIQVNVETDIFDELGESVDPIDAFSSYDAKYDEYHLQFGIHDWVFNFRNKAWAYDESPLIETATTRVFTDEHLDLPLGIAELTGNIEDLAGNIEDLIGSLALTTTQYVGLNDGNVVIEDPLAVDDNGEEFDLEIQSKDFTAMPDHDIVIGKLLISYNSPLTAAGYANGEFYYSTDKGTTWITTRPTYQLASGYAKNIVINNQVTGNQARWRALISSGKFEVLRYSVDLNEGGLTNDSSV